MAKAKVDTKETLRERIIAVIGNKSKWSLLAYHVFEIVKIIKDAVVDIYKAVKDYVKTTKEAETAE